MGEQNFQQHDQPSQPPRRAGRAFFDNAVPARLPEYLIYLGLLLGLGVLSLGGVAFAVEFDFGGGVSGALVRIGMLLAGLVTSCIGCVGTILFGALAVVAASRLLRPEATPDNRSDPPPPSTQASS